MRVPLATLTLVAALALGGLFPPSGLAQYPYPSGNYTRDRAYRHFLTSPAPVKTFSSPATRYEWGYDTPLESGRFYHVTPYEHERISPRGYERYETPAYGGGTVERWPTAVYPVYPVYPAPYPPVSYRPW